MTKTPERIVTRHYENGIINARPADKGFSLGPGNEIMTGDYTLTDHALALVAAEREACAAVADLCEKQNGPLSQKGFDDKYRAGLESAGQAIASAIRARSLSDKLLLAHWDQASREFHRERAEDLLIDLLSNGSGEDDLLDLIASAIADVHDIDTTTDEYARSVLDALIKEVLK